MCPVERGQPYQTLLDPPAQRYEPTIPKNTQVTNMGYYCSRCGNDIPDWANGVCPVCVRIERDEKRYGKRSRSKFQPLSGDSKAPKLADSQPIQSVMTSPAPLKQEVNVEALSKQASHQLRLRLEGVNDLLTDTYGTKVLVSQLLAERGIPRKRIERWRKDTVWLERFLKRLQQELNRAWAGLLSEQDLLMLSRWYGLGETRIQSLKSIAEELGITLAEAEVRQRKL
jgi:hypothetical protein